VIEVILSLEFPLSAFSGIFMFLASHDRKIPMHLGYCSAPAPSATALTSTSVSLQSPFPVEGTQLPKLAKIRNY